MPKPGKTGIGRIIDAQMYTIQGLKAIWKHEAAFRQETAMASVMIPAAFWVGTDAVQVALLIGVCLIVLVVELLNSAVEAVVDRIGPEMHELSGRAKDLGSAAVFISLIMAGLTWILILWQRFG